MAPRRFPSFFKILLHPSDPHLPLPPAFVRKHLENKIPEHPILQSVNGGHSWSLKIRRTGEIYCFADGWKTVVQDSQLGFGDFLVFWLVDQSTFKLLIFSPNGCEKHFPSKTQVEDDVDEEAETEKDDDYDGGRRGDEEEVDDEDPFFTTIICKNKLALPSKFVRLAGIDAERIITMKNPDGKEWRLSLRSEGKRYLRYYLSAGWADFRRGNQLSEGDKCVFKFIRSEDKLCLAKLTKKKRGLSSHPAKFRRLKFKEKERDSASCGGGPGGEGTT